jgi:plasmid stabilization system protein ParE
MAKTNPKYIIKWTPIAIDSLEIITLQVLERWNIETALSFRKKVDQELKQLGKNPKIYQFSKKSKLRKSIVHRNVSLFYRINKNVVELIIFVDNRSNHHF